MTGSDRATMLIQCYAITWWRTIENKCSAGLCMSFYFAFSSRQHKSLNGNECACSVTMMNGKKELSIAGKLWPHLQFPLNEWKKLTKLVHWIYFEHWMRRRCRKWTKATCGRSSTVLITLTCFLSFSLLMSARWMHIHLGHIENLGLASSQIWMWLDEVEHYANVISCMFFGTLSGGSALFIGCRYNVDYAENRIFNQKWSGT